MEIKETIQEELTTQNSETSEELDTVSGGDNEELTTVSGGDNIIIVQNDSALSEAIEKLLMENNELLSSLNEYAETEQTAETQSVWEKPLEEYTAEETFDMLIFICIVVVFIFHVIGGIITCNQ